MIEGREKRIKVIRIKGKIMGRFSEFYFSGSLDKNLTEVQMVERVKKLKSKQKISFDMKNLKEEKVDKFKRKIQEMNYYMVIDSGKIVVTKP